jgi:hypothetical protein
MMCYILKYMQTGVLFLNIDVALVVVGSDYQ